MLAVYHACYLSCRAPTWSLDCTRCNNPLPLRFLQLLDPDLGLRGTTVILEAMLQDELHWRPASRVLPSPLRIVHRDALYHVLRDAGIQTAVPAADEVQVPGLSLYFFHRLLFCDFLDSSHFPGRQSDLDPVRMRRRARQDVLHDAVRQFTRTLVMLLHDRDVETRFDVLADRAVHHTFN